MLLLFKGNREWKWRPVEKHSKGPQINKEGKLEGQSFKQKDKDAALSHVVCSEVQMQYSARNAVLLRQQIIFNQATRVHKPDRTCIAGKWWQNKKAEARVYFVHMPLWKQ